MEELLKASLERQLCTAIPDLDTMELLDFFKEELAEEDASVTEEPIPIPDFIDTREEEVGTHNESISRSCKYISNESLHGRQSILISDSDFKDEDNFTTITNEEEEEEEYAPAKKKQRRNSNDSDNSKKLRPHHVEMWQNRFAALVEFHKIHNHCNVPVDFGNSSVLCKWVRRQRYQYNLLRQNKGSSMTLDRIKLLKEIGFVWDSREVLWQERLGELIDFKEEYSNCDVPSVYQPNPQLGSWVKCQRRQHKIFLQGKPSNMTEERKAILEKYGFQWKARKYVGDLKQTPSNRERLHSFSFQEIENLIYFNTLQDM